MSGPRVSVVIPAYNAEATLARAVQSVLAQETPGVEVIVVDDVSSDGTAALAANLPAPGAGLRVLRQAVNGGPAAARNAGLRAARGEMVCFLDADDEYLPGFLRRCLGILALHARFASVKVDVELAGFDGDLDEARYIAVTNVLPSNVLIRRAAAELIGGFPEDAAFRGPAAGEDGVFRAILGQCFPQGHIPEKLFRHYVGGDSHFKLFLSRSQATDEGIAYAQATEEEASGAIDTASAAFLERFAARIRTAGASRLIMGSLGFDQQAAMASAEVLAFDQIAALLAGIPGRLTPREGHLLHLAAAFNPGDKDAAVVDIGPFVGLSTGWLAAGVKRGSRGKVVACDPDGWTRTGQRDAFDETVQRTGFGDHIEVLGGTARQAVAGFPFPVRLLVAGPDPESSAIPSALAAWITRVIPGGLVALAGAGARPLLGALADQLSGDPGAWRLAYHIESLAVFERIGW